MKWFKHLTASGSDPDIGELIDELGFEGYYLFFRTIEIMSTEFNIDNPGQNLFNFGWFLDQFSRKITRKKLVNFLEITSKNKRIFYSINGKSIHLNCPKLKNLTDEYTRQKPYRVIEKVTEKVTQEVTSDVITKVTPKIKDIRLKIKEEDIRISSVSDDKNHPKPTSIIFDFDVQFFKNISDQDKERWKKTYPACDIEQELLKITDWLVSNPSKRKANYKRFISNWLSRTQDSGGTKGINGKMTSSEFSELNKKALLK